MNRSLKRISLASAVMAAAFSVLPFGSARAQVPLPLPSSSPVPKPSASPTPEPSTTPTSSPSHEPKPKPSPKETPINPPPPRGGSGGSDGGSGYTYHPGKPQGSASPAPTPLAVRRGISAWLARPKSPSHTTTRLLELISDASSDGSQPTFADLRAGFGRFPVVGYVWYSDDYGAPRYFPYYHPHAGTDLFATRGTPAISVANGYVWKTRVGGTGGNAIWVRQDDGAYYYYGHLQAFAAGIVPGKRVRVGDHLAFVGATGESAIGTPPHVHFEVHPTGSPDFTANPKAYLDNWLRLAENHELGILGITVADLATHAPAGATRWNALYNLLSEPAASPPALWTAALDGSASIGYADLALEDLLARTDWDALGPGASQGATAGDLSSTLQPYDPLSLLLARPTATADGQD